VSTADEPAIRRADALADALDHLRRARCALAAAAALMADAQRQAIGTLRTSLEDAELAAGRLLQQAREPATESKTMPNRATPLAEATAGQDVSTHTSNITEAAP
jgi:hypothetical protein